MRTSLVLSGALLVLGVGLFRLGPVCVDDVASALSDLARSCVGDGQAEQDGRDLDQLSKVLQERIHAKHVTIDELLAGRITARQAAATFLLLNTQPPVVRFPEIALLGETTEEQSCRQVLCWAQSHSRFAPGDKEEQLLQRLERELEELRRRPEQLHLPTCYP